MLFTACVEASIDTCGLMNLLIYVLLRKEISFSSTHLCLFAYSFCLELHPSSHLDIVFLVRFLAFGYCYTIL